MRIFKNVRHENSKPKVYFNENFSTLRYNKNSKKLTILNMSKTVDLHVNNAENLLKNL